MGDRLLAGIIELEAALQEEVRREELRAAAWLSRELAALDTGIEPVRGALESWRERQTAAARAAAEAEAEGRRAAGEARCAALAALPETFLEELLRGRLDRLLPEAGDDHPHGQD